MIVLLLPGSRARLWLCWAGWGPSSVWSLETNIHVTLTPSNTQSIQNTYLFIHVLCWRQLAVIHLGPESDALMILCFVPCDVKYPDTDLLWVTNFNHNFASTPTSKFAIICTGLKLQIILFICVLMYWILTVLKTLCTYIYQVYPLPARKMIWKGFIHVYLIIVEIVPMRPFNQSFIH